VDYERKPIDQRNASCPGKALRRLSGDLGDEVEVLVEVHDGEPGQLGRGGDDEVGDRGCTVVPQVSEQRLHFDGAILDRRGLVLDRH